MNDEAKQPTSVLRALTSDPKHGRLPVLLLALTVVTGLVDAVSILQLGRVFVANMTGNVVFVAFAAAGAPGFSLGASLVALGGFLVGARVGGLVIRRRETDRVQLLSLGVGAEIVFVGGALVVAATVGPPFATWATDTMAGSLAIAMGWQNATARRLAVPDLTTTVLTMTLTGLAADTDAPAGSHTVTRRILAVAAMLAGGAAGAVLVLHGQVAAALGAATGLLLVVFVATAKQPPGGGQVAPPAPVAST